MANDLSYILKIKDEATSELKGFQKGLEDTDKQANNASKTMGNFGTSITSAMKVATVAIAGVTTALIGMVKLGEAGGKLLDVQNSFNTLAENAGKSGDKLIETFRDVTHNTIADATMMKNSVKASMLGIPIDKMSNLMQIARTQAVTMGEDVGYMLESIVTGVGRASPLILDNLGITLKMGEVYEKTAKSLGKTTEELTDAERKQGLLNAVIEWGNEKQIAMGGEVDSNAESFQQLQTSVQNMINMGMSALVPVLSEVAVALESFLKSDQFQAFITGIGNAIAFVVPIIQGLFDALMVLSPVFQAFFNWIGTVAVPVVTNFWLKFKESFDAIAKQIGDFVGIILPMIEPALRVVEWAWNLIWGNISAYFTFVWETIKNTLNLALGLIKGAIQIAMGAIEIIFSVALGILTLNWDTAWQGMKKGFESIWEGIKTSLVASFDFIKGHISNSLNYIIDIVNNAIGAINSVEVAGKSTNIGKINRLEFSDGGFVPYTGMAKVHAGEFVLSREMLAGKQSVPSNVSSSVTNNNQPINVTAVINTELDAYSLGNILGQQLAFAGR